MGKKYIIELDHILEDTNGKKLYVVKNFNSLVFDEIGLSRLEEYDAKKTYQEGYYDGKKRGYEAGEKTCKIKTARTISQAYKHGANDAVIVVNWLLGHYGEDGNPDDIINTYFSDTLIANNDISHVMQVFDTLEFDEIVTRMQCALAVSLFPHQYDEDAKEDLVALKTHFDQFHVDNNLRPLYILENIKSKMDAVENLPPTVDLMKTLFSNIYTAVNNGIDTLRGNK